MTERVSVEDWWAAVRAKHPLPSDDLIDLPARAICRAINSRTHMRTIYSCAGHWVFPLSAIEPYIAFLAPQDLAHKLNSLLTDLRWSGDLVISWRVIGWFRPDCDGALTWCLEPCDVRLARPFNARGLYLARRDLKTLPRIIEGAFP